jgi:hypothetical protein
MMVRRKRKFLVSMGLGIMLASLASTSWGWAVAARSDVTGATGWSDYSGAPRGGEDDRGGAAAPSETVIVASPNDPYYDLAEEIGAAEHSPVVHSWEGALAGEAGFVLWVVSPHGMSDHDLVDLGLARQRQKSTVSIGIITGSSVEQARQLWLRRDQASGRLVVAANAANPSGHLQSRIVVFGAGGTAIHPLTLSNVQRYLERADYFTFTGHGGDGHLALDEETRLRAKDIPALSSIVVGTASCNTVRVWEEDSIALAFVDGGAAAYAGFAYSPNEGYLLGEFYGAPFRYTWPDFPIGHVVEIQNRGAVKGFARFPYYYLLGDPRISLQEEAPYRLIEDTEDGSARRLRYDRAPEGIIPLRIPGGARYSFVQIPGVISSWGPEPFYNSRLEMVDFGEDKYVLFEHPGGPFEVMLSERPPLYWPVADVLMDSLDHTLVYLPQTGGDVVALFTGGAFCLVLFRLLRRTRRARLYLVASVLTAVFLASLQGAYALARLDEVTITSKMVEFSPLAVVGTFLVTAPAAFFFLATRSWAARGVALAVATAPTWASIVFSFAIVGVANNFVFRRGLGASIYNHGLGLLPLPTLLVQACAILFAFILVRAVVGRLEKRPRQVGDNSA